jgi:hypothetical protein
VTISHVGTGVQVFTNLGRAAILHRPTRRSALTGM